MIPQPPARDSACRAGNGFQMSNKRKSIKPSSKYFQLSAEFSVSKPNGTLAQASFGSLHQTGIAHPSSRVRCCPDTSSMTTRPGSFTPQNFAVRSALHTPIAAAKSVSTIWQKTNGSMRHGAICKKASSSPRLVTLTPSEYMLNAHHGPSASKRPPRDPHVPGALGRYPSPHAVAIKTANRGLRAGVVDDSGSAEASDNREPALDVIPGRPSLKMPLPDRDLRTSIRHTPVR